MDNLEKLREAISGHLVEIATRIPIVHEEGFNNGRETEYDAFWSAYQDGGNRRDYINAFAGGGWNNDSFKPKYNIVPVNNSNNMFQGNRVEGNLKDILNGLGRTLDLSNVTRFQYGFASTKFTHIGVIDLSKADNRTTYVFSSSSSLVSIEKLIVSENNLTFANWFDGCTALTDITIVGKIANSFDIHDAAMLSNDSALSIMKALSISGGTGSMNGKALTLPKAVQTFVETDSGCSILYMTATNAGWTISFL